MDAERGFTFVEVLVVMVVLAFGLLGVLQATLLADRLERRGDAVTTGTLLAQERVERIAALGWDRATAGLTAATLPPALGVGGVLPREDVVRPGARFLLVYERVAGALEPPLCVVRCFWAIDQREFEARNVVRLALRRRP